MNLLQQLPMKGMRCGRQSASQHFASLCSLPDRRYHPETSSGMRPSLRSWHKPEARQARCRFHATRAQGTSQPNILEPRPHLVNVSFKVQYKCSFGQSIVLVGDVAPLGKWASSRGRRMQWSRGDYWSCDVMVPAGSSLECKYVIVDDGGEAMRWQEGSNMVIQVPYTTHGLAVEKYDVEISWCKNFVNLTAHPLITAAAAAAAATGASASARAATSSSVALAAPVSPVAAPVIPLTAWARAKGSSLPAQATSASTCSGVNSPAAVSAHQAKQLAQCSTASEAAGHASRQMALSHAPSQDQQQRQCQPSISAVAPQQSQAAQQHRHQQQQQHPSHSQATTSGSLVTTLMQAATAVMDPAQATPTSPAPSSTPRCASFGGQPHVTGAAPGPIVAPAVPSPAVPAPSSPSFQLTPASDEEPMSIVLPSRRGSSPPVKISLSSSFSKLMEMPASAPRNGCTMAPAAVHGTPGVSGSCSSAGSAGASASASGARASPAKVTAAGIQSHPIDLGASAAAATSPVSAAAAAGTSISSSTSTPHNAASSGPGSSHSPRGASGRRAQPSSSTSLTPVWGMEYDVYATAYGIPYMHTPFDLEAYAVYDQTSTEPVSAAVPRLNVTAGLGGLVSKAMAAGADLLESAVQAARGTKTASSASPSPTLSASSAADSRLLSSDLLATTAASTAVALANLAPAAPAAPRPPAAAVPIVPKPPVAAMATVATAPLAALSTAPVADAAAASSSSSSAPVDSYRQVSRSSPSVSDWAARTLMELSSGRSMVDEDSDDDETADDEALMAQALASPTAPADMTALLQQLGTALGRSVRLRYEGIEPASSDLLELDRKIALAASKLYRQRDALLTGWVRKETRRQLAAAATAGGRQPANSVTPM